jgi:hypothetical protein
MSDVEKKLSGEKNQDNLIQSSEGIVYGLTPISHLVGTGTVAGAVGVAAARAAGIFTSVAFSETVKNSELENESKYSAELDEVFTQLHEADDYIAETRQNTVQLGIETRSMLDDLRKQLS